MPWRRISGLSGGACERVCRAVMARGCPQRLLAFAEGVDRHQLSSGSPDTGERDGACQCCRSELLPPYLKKARRVEAILPWLYLKGISPNDFNDILRALLGESVKSLSAATIAQLKSGWEFKFARRREHDWGSVEFVYVG